jgi:hypothetical protein
MIGLYDGIGKALILSLFFTIFIPIMTVLYISQFSFFNRLNKIKKSIILIIIFFIMGIITFLIVRNFRVKSFDGLFLISITLIVVNVYLKWIKPKH